MEKVMRRTHTLNEEEKEMLADEMKSVYSGISQGNAGVSRASGANYALVADVNS